MKVKNYMLLAKKEIKTLASHALRTFTPKSLFKYEMEDINYELSPCLHFCVMEVLCYYNIVAVGFYCAIFVNVCLCCMEITLIFTKNMVIAEHALILCFQILGVMAANIILPARAQILNVQKRYKDIQWSLKNLRPKQRAVISKMGLYQSLAFEFTLVLCFIDFFVIFPEISKTSVITAALEYENWFLTIMLYFLEIGDVLTMCYFVLMVPQLQTYFASQAEVQIFLLTQYVNCLNDYLKTHESLEQDKIIKYHLRVIYTRYCEIKQVFLDNRNLISSAGIKYVLPSSLIAVYIVYAEVEGNLSVMTLAMYYIVFSAVLIITMISGQRYEDEWENFYDSLCKLPWYTWNLSNQKTYLTMVTGSNIVQLIILQTIVVNYSIFIKVGRFLYSGANMVFNTHSK